MAASPSVVTSDVERWRAENEFSTISKEFERVDDDSPTEHEVVDVSSEGEPVISDREPKSECSLDRPPPPAPASPSPTLCAHCECIARFRCLHCSLPVCYRFPCVWRSCLICQHDNMCFACSQEHCDARSPFMQWW